MLPVTVLFGLGFALTLVGVFVYPPVHEMPAAFDWKLTTAIFLALLGLHALLLRGRSRLVWKLAALCFFLVPTAFALSVGGVMTLNGLLDGGEPVDHVASLVAAYRAKSSIGPSRPYPRLQVTAWGAGEPDPWLDVDAELYDAVIPGEDALDVVAKPGWLGIEWIVDVRAAPSGQGTGRPARYSAGRSGAAADPAAGAGSSPR